MVLESFQSLLDRIQSPFVLISYNSEGLVTVSQLRTLLEKYGVVKVYKFAYKRYQSQKMSEKTKSIKEYLFLIQCFKRSTNESLGISVEQNICQLTKIDYSLSFNCRSLECNRSK